MGLLILYPIIKLSSYPQYWQTSQSWDSPMGTDFQVHRWSSTQNTLSAAWHISAGMSPMEHAEV